MSKIEKVDATNFEDVPDPCKCCLYRQTSGPFNQEMKREKQEWFNKVAKEFGNCGSVAYCNSRPIGFVQYAPTRFFPRAKEYASGPPNEDAIFLACLYIISQEARGKGFGTAMLENLLSELKKRTFKAVETFARKNSENNPSGPLKLYLKHDFKIENDKDDFPLVRFEL